MGNEQSAIALLLFRVGPVLCCAPANPVQTIISPPKLTRPPGSNDAKPGIFYHADHVVSVNELRHRFGINETEREQPGRLIITLQGEAFIAYWVDEIIEVIDTPKEGWSEPSSHLPQGVFSKTLLLDEKIYLFADFAHFENLPESGYLSQYIDKLSNGLSAAETVTEVIEDKPEVQANTTASPEAAAPPVTENIAMTLTETEQLADTVQSDTQVSGADDGEINQTEDKTDAQATTQQPSGADEIDTSKAPALEPAVPPTQIEDEKAISPEAGGQETPFNTAATSDITTPDSLAQTASSLDDIKNDNAPDSTTETFEARPESVAANPTEPVKEATEKSILETIATPAEKSARLETGYLDPVPAVVPESEQEPEKPPFPWQNLAAAIVLFMTIAGIGIYFSLTSSDKTSTQRAKNPQPVMTQQLDVAHNKKPAPSRHEDENATETVPAPDAESVAITDTDDQQDKPAMHQDENEYHAVIKPDKKGVTIMLHSPQNVPVFKATKQASIEAPTRQKDISVPADKPKKKAKPDKQEIIHIVVKGDTLWAIAERYVNNPYKYSRLAKLSKIKNPDRIYPGNRVRILRHDNNVE